jgi:hypothetical protein
MFYVKNYSKLGRHDQEESKLVADVDIYGTSSWAKIAVNVPGRNEKQCYQKW